MTHKLQSREELAALRAACKQAFAAEKTKIHVCGGTGCVAGGSLDIYARLQELLKERGIPVEVELADEPHGDVVGIKKSGCHGFCEMGPLVRIEPNGWLYTKVQLSDCEEIVEETIQNGRFIERLGYKKEGEVNAFGGGIAAGTCDRFIEKLKAQGFAVDVFVPDGGWEGMAKPVREVYDKYDLILYLVALATKSNQTVVRIEWAEPMGADVPVFMNSVPTIMISFENPYHLLDAPRIKTYINTYGGTDEIQDELMKKLTGKSEFTGKSPVDAFCGKWDTKL